MQPEALRWEPTYRAILSRHDCLEDLASLQTTSRALHWAATQPLREVALTLTQGFLPTVSTVFALIRLSVAVVGTQRTEFGTFVALVGCVVALVGTFVALVGCVVALVGCVVALVGCVVALVGTPVALVGTPVALVGTPVALVGTPVALVGTPVALVRFMPAGHPAPN